MTDSIPLTRVKARTSGFLGLVTGVDMPQTTRPLSIEEAMKRTFAKASKYGNRKTEYNGRTFMSAHEARVAQELDTCRRAVKKSERVTDIQYQVPFRIVVKGKLVCRYVADFVVTYADKHVEVIDAKGVLTETYKLKKKLMKIVNGIEIREI